jgi:hypothetical protein
MKELTIPLTDKEYDQYIKKGQSEYRRRLAGWGFDTNYLVMDLISFTRPRGSCT